MNTNYTKPITYFWLVTRRYRSGCDGWRSRRYGGYGCGLRLGLRAGCVACCGRTATSSHGRSGRRLLFLQSIFVALGTQAVGGRVAVEAAPRATEHTLRHLVGVSLHAEKWTIRTTVNQCYDLNDLIWKPSSKIGFMFASSGWYAPPPPTQRVSEVLQDIWTTKDQLTQQRINNAVWSKIIIESRSTTAWNQSRRAEKDALRNETRSPKQKTVCHCTINKNIKLYEKMVMLADHPLNLFPLAIDECQRWPSTWRQIFLNMMAEIHEGWQICQHVCCDLIQADFKPPGLSVDAQAKKKNNHKP